MNTVSARKSLFFLGLIGTAIVLLISCKKDVATTPGEGENPAAMAQIAERSCGTQEAFQQQLSADPSLQGRMDWIEAFTQDFIDKKRKQRTEGTTNTLTTLTIPVVVNVVYNTAAQNITDAQIQSQITALNEDFQRLNADTVNTPSDFKPSAASLAIKFSLYRIVRKSSTVTSWTNDNKVKGTRTGGLAPLNPTTMLNIWVCNLSGGLLGYAQFPGGSSATDGVVIQYNAFGTTGTLMTRFNRGRTATHEIGHWMNLRHIWGDGACASDYVGDTPSHNASNTGAPAYPHYSTCTGTPVEMTMNYLDYTDDAAMNLFSLGQRDRARACFASGGPRYNYYIK